MAKNTSPLFNWKIYAKKLDHKKWSRHNSILHYIVNISKEEILKKKLTIEDYLIPNCNDMAICLCFFSYCRYKKPFENLLVVLNDLDKAHIPYFIIELLYPNQESIVPYATKIVCAETVMFHKENLWNIIEKNVPEKYSKLLFLDTDIRFNNKNWYDETSQLLNSKTVIQPMDLIYNNNKLTYSLCGALKNNITKLNLASHHPGYAVGIDRNLFHKIGGFYDRAIIGSGDTIFWNSILNAIDKLSYNASQLAKHISAYHRISDYSNLCKINKNHIRVGCLNNNIAVHLPHGKQNNRRYADRAKGWIIDQLDLYKNNDGIYENKELDQYMRCYFDGRKEDEL